MRLYFDGIANRQRNINESFIEKHMFNGIPRMSIFYIDNYQLHIYRGIDDTCYTLRWKSEPDSCFTHEATFPLFNKEIEDLIEELKNIDANMDRVLQIDLYNTAMKLASKLGDEINPLITNLFNVGNSVGVLANAKNANNERVNLARLDN